MTITYHAEIRGQQRGIPPLIDQWLDLYGEEEYDGHGAIRRFFTGTSIRNLEKDCGRQIISKLSEYFGCYKVVSSSSNVTITLGHRTQRIKRG